MAEYFLNNGVPSPSVSASDRGLAYGDGVFETVKVSGGDAQFMLQHLQRLQEGCWRLGISLDMAALRRELQQLLECAGSSSGVLKITVTRGGMQRGYRSEEGVSGNRYLQYHVLQDNRFERMQAGVALTVCRHRLPINPALAGLKHLNRLDNVLARNEWQDAAIDEGLMLDSAGRVVEGTMSNLFFVSSGELVTPSLHRCGVAGVMRRVVLEELAPQLGISTRVADVVLEDLYHAQEIFICNSLIGICPVLTLNCVEKSAGAVAISLQGRLEDLC